MTNIRDNCLTIAFENCDETRFAWEHVKMFGVCGVTEDVVLIDGDLVHIPTCESAHIVISEEANREHLQFDQFSTGISIFDFIAKEAMISSIVTKSCSKETEYVVYPDQEVSCYRDGTSLVIKIG